MTTENNVAAGEATEINTPVQAETPEITAPEAQVEETQTPAETEEEREAKAVKALQRRIDKRTRDLYAERAEKDQLRRELEALRQTAKPAETQDEGDVETRAKQRAAEIVREQQLSQRVADVLSKGKSIEGFESAASTAIEELGLVDSRGRPTERLHVLFEMDNAADLLAHIGANPDVADELSGLSPTRLAVRLARLEDELKAAKAPKTSAAPKPIKPVGGPPPSGEDYSPAMTDAQFEALRRRQIAARRN
jgi:hypothetical protein